MIAALWNAVMCLAISIVCWSYLLGSRSEDRLSIVANAGLLLLAVGMFVSAFAPMARHADLAWWTMLSRTGAAVVAAALYERRFGTRAQLLALWVHVSATPRRWLDTYRRIRIALHMVSRR